MLKTAGDDEFCEELVAVQLIICENCKLEEG